MTLICYSSGLPEMAEENELYRSYDLPHNDWLTPDTVLLFGGRYIILWGCFQMVMLFVSMY